MILTTIAVLLYVVSCYGFAKESRKLIDCEVTMDEDLQNIKGWVWTTLVTMMALLWPVVIFVISFHAAVKKG